MKSLILCVFLACTVSVVAQVSDGDPKKDALCEKWKSIPLPAEASSLPKPASFPTCDSYKLYSGIGGEIDFQAARNCAWSERLAMKAEVQQNSSDPISSVIGGSVILSQLYANGEGVQKNLPLALRLACEKEASEELDAIEDLASRLEKPDSSIKKFRYCDHAMTTFSMNFCASYDAEVRDQQRSDELKQLSADWTQPQKEAFDLLIKSQASYAIAHAQGEINTGGTIRGLMAIGSEQSLRDNFVEVLKAFEKGQLPQGSAADASKSDSELNELFRKDIAASKKQKPDYGSPLPKGIQAAQRAWLKYRDAWIAFAKLRYPTVSPDSWLTLLTNDRIAVLRDTYSEIGPD